MPLDTRDAVIKIGDVKCLTVREDGPNVIADTTEIGGWKMGGEPWLVRKPFESNVAQVLDRHKKEILQQTPDWPEIKVSEIAKVRDPDGDGWPDPESICCLAAFDESQLMDMFGTARPPVTMRAEDLWSKINWDCIPRGEGHYLILYKDDKPEEVCFMGYSFD